MMEAARAPPAGPRGWPGAARSALTSFGSLMLEYARWQIKTWRGELATILQRACAPLLFFKGAGGGSPRDG